MSFISVEIGLSIRRLAAVPVLASAEIDISRLAEDATSHLHPLTRGPCAIPGVVLSSAAHE